MRLAAISDMHGHITAFEAVVADLRQQRPDAIVCLGDISLRGPRPAECIALLRNLDPLCIVRGNHDECLTDSDWVPRSFREEVDLAHLHYHNNLVSHHDLQWVNQQPPTETLVLEGVRAELFHAAPWSRTAQVWPWAPDETLGKLCTDPSAGLVLFGHMHLPFVRYAAGRVVINTGAIGLTLDGDNRASYAIIDIENGNLAAQLRRVTYDVEAAVKLVRESMPYAHVLESWIRIAAYPFQPQDLAHRDSPQ